MPVTLGQSALFFQKCLAYWSQKRLYRNGVPLIRRLQAVRNSSGRSEETNDDEKRKLKEQLRYWQRLRHDLERARLLIELIKKREKMKMNELQKAAAISLLKLNPWAKFLRDLLAELTKLDTMQIFGVPVTDKVAPMYSKIIDFPMDLGTMEKKIENMKYKCFAAFEHDVELIAKNCQHYNASNTIFYKLGKEFQSKSAPILKQARKLSEHFNATTGTLK